MSRTHPERLREERRAVTDQTFQWSLYILFSIILIYSAIQALIDSL